MRAYLTLSRANLREFLRDRAAVFWTIAFPILFVVVFGLIFGREGGQSYNVGLVNQDASPQAAIVTETLGGMDVFEISAGDEAAEVQRLRDGERRAVIVIPKGFGAAIDAGAPVPVDVSFDPSQQTTSQVVVPVIERALEVADRNISNTRPVVFASFSTLQSERLSTLDFIIPGIVAMSVMNAGIFGAVNLVSLRERRVLRRLQATPLSRFTLVGADVTIRVVVVFVQAAMLIAIGHLAFGVKLLGNLPALAGVLALGALAFLAIGFFLGAFAKTEQGFFPLAQVFTFPMMFLSGVFFPVEAMPEWLRPLINLLPLTYLGDAVRQLMTGGAPLYPMALNLGVMAAFLAVFFALAVRFFKFE